MSGQVSRGSVAEYQADERAEVAWLRFLESETKELELRVHEVLPSLKFLLII